MSAQPAAQQDWTVTTQKGGVQYEFVAPPGLDKAKSVPVILMLPPGAQDARMAREMVLTKFGDDAPKRGYVLAVPIASDDAGVDKVGLVESVLEDLSSRCTIEQNKVHLVGVSNGGRSAFAVAVRLPQRVASICVLPGYADAKGALPKLGRIKGVPVAMWVGENDESWLKQAEDTQGRLERMGSPVTLHKVAGQSHEVTIPSADIFSVIEAARPKAPAQASKEEQAMHVAREAVSAALDDFHDAASKADFDRYFSRFAPGAVFVGTDATERWTLEEFKKYAEPNFRIGKGWTYTPVQREITIGAGGTIAWFDEVLDNAKLGLCRGSGVLIRMVPPRASESIANSPSSSAPGSTSPSQPGAPAPATTQTPESKPEPKLDSKPEAKWLVAHYVLSMAVPNETAEQVARMTKPRQKKPAGKTGDGKESVPDGGKEEGSK